MLPRPFTPQSSFVFRSTLIIAASLATLTASPAFAQTPDALPGSGWVVINGASPWSEPPETEILTSVLDSISLTVDVPGFEVETVYHGSDAFQKLSFLGESFTSEVGKPELPLVRMMLAIPDCESYSLSVVLGDSTEFSDATIWPVPSWAVGYQDEYEYVYEVFAIDEESYEEDILYPQGAAVIADDGWVRDQRYVILEIHPVRYNPGAALLTCYSSVSVRIRFEDPVQTNLRGVGPLEPACRSVMANYDGVGGWFSPGGRGESCDVNVDWFSTVGGCADFGTDYLMIVEDGIIDIDTIEALAEKKSWYDCLNVALVRVSDIANPISPEAIKDFIQGVYSAGTAANVPDGHLGYVLLIGDAREAEDPGQGQSQELLPAYEDSLPLTGAPGTDDWVPTDHWYACVADTDHVADLAIGRLAVGDTVELQTEVTKIIGHEPIRLSSEWASSIFLSCSFAEGDPGGGHVGVDQREIPAIKDILADEGPMNIGELHVHEYVVCDSGALPRCAHREYGRPSNIAAVNDSVLIMLLWGHGSECGSLSFKSEDVDDLHNSPALPFWINISCTTGNFANVTHCSADGFDCLGEVLMHQGPHGSVAFFGATKATSHKALGRLIIEALYDQSYPMIGQAIQEAKMRFHVQMSGSPSLRDLYAFNLLGDPTLNLFLGEETGYGGACDLVVRARDVVVTPELANYGDEMTFECLVTNEGPEATGSEAIVSFDLYDSDGQMSSSLTDTIGSLNGWASTTAAVTWTPLEDAVGAYDLFVRVDPGGLIDELFESNNRTGQPAHFYVHFYAGGFPTTLPSSPQTPMLVSPVTVCHLGEDEAHDILLSYGNGHVAAMDQSGGVVWSYSPPGGGAPGAFCPAVADFDLDGTPEVAIVVPGHELPGLPREDKALVLKPAKSGGPQIWKQAEIGETYSAPLVVDIDPLDGRPEVAIVGIDDQEEGRLSVWDFAPQTPVQSWEEPLGSGSPWQRTSPPTAVNMGLHPADLVTWNYTVDDTLMLCTSGDGELNWKLSIAGWEGHRGFGIAAGDLDGSGEVLLVSAAASPGELIVSSSTHPVEVLWTASIPGTCEVAIGNVDSDDDLEIVCAGGRSVLVFENDSSGVPAWTADLAGTAIGEPLIGDFDGGDDVEIIVGTLSPDDQTLLHILSVPAGEDTLGPVVDPVEIPGVYATGALCDLDDNGRNDIVFATDDGLLHRLEYWGASEPRFEWPTYRHDERNSGLYEQPVAGSLTQPTTWSGDMFMEGDVEVPEGMTLYIASGTDVEVAHDWDSMVSGRDTTVSELIVEGALDCAGGSLWPIEFRSDASPPDELPEWYGITVEEGATCALAHVEVSHAEKSLWAMVPEAFDVRECRFLSQSEMGLHVRGCADPSVVADCTIDQAPIGIRADSCATSFTGNTIRGVREYGIRLYDDRGSTVEGNEITVGPGTAPLAPPRGIYCSNAFDAVEISILDNDVTVSIEDPRCEGICVYAVPWASVVVTGNEAAWTGPGNNYTKGIRLGKTSAVAHWNRLTGFYYHFYVEPDDDQIPHLGDTDTYGNNATDDEAGYNVYAVAQPPSDPLPAQMNWWGTTNPSGRKFWGVGIDILWEPCLEEDPGARGEQPKPGDVALRYRLDQNRPNPFNPVTFIGYAVPRQCRVRIAVYDLNGRLVRVLTDEARGAGEYQATWDGRNERGQDVGSGVYFCRMEAGSFSETRKLVILK
jgi:parallel beta-helix repeat protein